MNQDFKERIHNRFVEEVIATPVPKAVWAAPHNGNGGMFIHATGELSECARLHEEEVIKHDSYKLQEFYREVTNVKYIVDIGANVGAFSYYAAQLFPDAQVIACEAVPECMYWVRENTNNQLIYVQKAIVGDPNIREVTFNVCKWAGNGHVEGKFDMESWKRYGCEVKTKITIPAATLLQVVHDYSLPRIDLLKVDTEGSEPDIFDGVKPWLGNIRYIMGEWHSQADLIRIINTLKDTHDALYEPAPHFKEVDGRPANGSIYAKLK